MAVPYADLQLQYQSIKGEIDAATAQLKVTKSKFEIAFQAVSQAIADENQQIAVYLN